MELTSEPRRIGFADLESFVRTQARTFIQSLLEEEVNELLGRSRSVRREGDGSVGYRNGHGKERRFSLSNGTITVRRPRVRGLEETFESRVLPLFQRCSQEVSGLLPQLYLHGLASGDFDMAMRGLLGDGAPLSASSIQRMKAIWLAEYAAWKQSSLADLQVVYAWVDGIYVKAGLEKDKAVLLVMIGALSDGSKRVLAVESGHRESEASWSSLLRNLKERGMNCPRLVVGDGNLGIWPALARVFPDAEGQRCWIHRMRNVLDCVGKKRQAEAKEMLSKVMYAPSVKEAEREKSVFQKWARGLQYDKAADKLDSDWERMTAYYALPMEHWKHLRTTNIIESPFASVRLRTAASKRYKRVDAASAMIWKLLMVAELTFRKLNAPELLEKVAAGGAYKDGIAVETKTELADYEQAA